MPLFIKMSKKPNLFEQFRAYRAVKGDELCYKPLEQNAISEEDLAKLKKKEYYKKYYEEHRDRCIAYSREYYKKKKAKNVTPVKDELQQFVMGEDFQDTQEIKEMKETLGHRDTSLSIMYDLIRNTDFTKEQKLEIIRIVIDEQCGQDLNSLESLVVDMYYHGYFR